MDTWVLALSEHERPSVYRDQSSSPPPSLKDSCKNIDHVITKFLSLPSTRSRCPWARSCCRPYWQNSLLTCCLVFLVEQLSFSFSVEIISLFYDHISQTLSLNFSQLERIFALDTLQQKFLLTDGFANVKIRLVCKCHIVGFAMKGFFPSLMVLFTFENWLTSNCGLGFKALSHKYNWYYIQFVNIECCAPASFWRW